MRFPLSALTVLALTACGAEVPNSAAGVGFSDYSGYQQQREAQLSGRTVVLPPAANDGAGEAAATAAGGSDTVTAPATAAAAVPAPVVTTNNPEISDEQSFSAVSSRESIESDRARLEAQRAQYELVEPTAVPQRTGSGGPNVVEYAIRTTNRVGEKLYRRSGLVGDSALARKCAQYASSDLAQEAFLKAGGPERDPKGLDPDGDGFACYWDPSPFRLARGG